MSESLLCMARPATVLANAAGLDIEFRDARWTYHRLLDIEDEHQVLVDRTAEECAPGIVRCGRLVARLHRRARRRERTTAGRWSPNPRPELLARLTRRLGELREQRNADPDWKEALRWFDLPDDDAPSRGGARRKAGETDEQFAERCANRRDRLTRREARRAALYEQRRVHWSTWNALLHAVDQARAAVLKRRKAGMPAEWRRPRWDDPSTITAEPGCWRIIERGSPWWILDLRLLEGWVRLRAKLGNWHAFDERNIRRVQLTRRKSGRAWTYSLTASISGVTKRVSEGFAPAGLVALDWGHREHGHSTAANGMRVFTWLGADGASGEILLPAECRALLDAIDATKARMDQCWNARCATLGDRQRGRYGYRQEILRRGVLTNEEANWLTWETRYERRLESMRARLENLRRETYLQAVHALRQRYAQFAIEDETTTSHRRRATEKMESRRKRSNRELSARYAFVQLCEQSGAELIPVPARNSTRECPDCGALAENGPEIVIVCVGCGRARDKDHGACRVILSRAREALAKRIVTTVNQVSLP